MLDEFDYLLTVEEAQEILKMSRNCVYEILRSGELKGYQQGRNWRIPKQAVMEYVSKRSGLNVQHPL